MLCIATTQSKNLTFQTSIQSSEDNQRIALQLVTSTCALFPLSISPGHQALKFVSTSSLCHPSLYLPYLCQDPNRGGIVLWLIQLAHQIHEILSVKSSLSNSFPNFYSTWIKPFSASMATNLVISRGDELALSLLSVWADIPEKFIPWNDESESSQSVNWDANEFTSQLDAALVAKLSNIPHSSGGVKTFTKGPEKASTGDESHQTIVNLTARLIGAILSVDSSLSCRILSKALTRLPHETLLPICFSGPISRFPLSPWVFHLTHSLYRCIMDPFFLCKSNNRERSTLLTSFILVTLSFFLSLVS